MKKQKDFIFDGGASTYWGTQILAFLIVLFTLGIFYPYALVLVERWKAKHTYIKGKQLVFKGKAIGLLGNWIKWFVLCVITFGIYIFWVIPKLEKWKKENTYIVE